MKLFKIYAIFCLSLGCCYGQNNLILGSGELHATFESIGISVPFIGDDNQDSDHSIQYRATGTVEWVTGHQLTRVKDDMFVGSLVMLEEGMEYDLLISFSDPDGVSGSPVSGSISTRTEVNHLPTGNHWYVQPDGNDDGAGSVNDPFEHVEFALSTAQPGDAVHLQEGVFHQSADLSFHGSVSGEPIFLVADGDNVLLDGSDPDLVFAPGSWIDEGGGVYAVDLSYRPFLIAVQDSQLYRYTSWNDFTNDVHDLGRGYYQNGANRLFVRFPQGTNPSNTEIFISSKPFALHLYYCENFIIQGITFQNFGSNEWSKAIYLDGAKHVTLRSCHFRNNTVPVWIKRQTEDCVVEYNTFLNTGPFMWPWSIVKGTSHETSAIVFSGGFTGRRNVIRYNRIEGYFDGMGVGGESGMEYSYETDVYGNLFVKIPDDIIEADGTSSNIRFWNNTATEFHMGVSIAPGDRGPVYIFRNLFYNYGNTLTNTVDGYPASQVKFNHGYATETGPMFFYHNTSVGDNGEISALLLKTPGIWELLTCRNNIWIGNAFALEDWDGSRPCDFDYDVMHTTGNSPYARVGGTTYVSFTDYQSGTGQESHGRDILPQFMDVESGDFRLVSESDLVDQGVLIPGFNHDYAGSGPDPGAFECGMNPPPAILNLKASVDGPDILLTWQPIHGSTYTIRLFDIPFGSRELITVMGWPDTSYAFSDLSQQSGGAYFDVRAFMNGIEGPPGTRVGKLTFQTDTP